VDELARFVSEQLEQKCSGLDEILSLTEDDLAGAPASDGAGTPFTGIKFGIAHPVVHGLRRARPLIARLRQVLEITGPAAAPLPGRAPFAGLSFVFTGRMRSLERKAAQAQVAALGGKTPDDVTADLSFLVIGDEGSPLFGQGAKGSKQVKAEKHLARGAHIRIISESEFLKRLQEAQGKI
jgi:NAD-dependent DNA ligase